MHTLPQALPPIPTPSAKSRLDLPVDQKIYLSLATFIQTADVLGDQCFRLDAHRGTARVDLLQVASKEVLRSASYSYMTADDREIALLQEAISRDFASPVQPV